MAAAKPAFLAANSTTAGKPPSTEQQLLEVAEEEVVIDFKPNSKCRVDLRLRSLHPTLPVAFKVQTSSPLKFLVSPPRGAIPPLSSATIRVVLRPQPHAPQSFPRSRGDRFLVLSSLSATHLDSATSIPGNASAGAIRLRVFFGGPYLLRLAADAGDAAAVRLILRRQPHLVPVLEPEAAVPDADHWAPLHAAAARGDCGEVRRLGPEALAARDKDGRTALHVAAAAGEAEAVAELVEMGADAASADARGKTPLDVAREKGYVKRSGGHPAAVGAGHDRGAARRHPEPGVPRQQAHRAPRPRPVRPDGAPHGRDQRPLRRDRVARWVRLHGHRERGRGRAQAAAPRRPGRVRRRRGLAA
ncbi:unnamed protein product [Alopecurus aequalis]